MAPGRGEDHGGQKAANDYPCHDVLGLRASPIDEVHREHSEYHADGGQQDRPEAFLDRLRAGRP
jgi:hypothetical protein